MNDAVAGLDVRIDNQRPRPEEITVSDLVFPFAVADGSVKVGGESIIDSHQAFEFEAALQLILVVNSIDDVVEKELGKFAKGVR